MRRRSIIVIISIIVVVLGGLAVSLRYREVATAPRPVVIYLRVLDNASGRPIEHAHVRVLDEDATTSVLTDINGVALLKLTARPNQDIRIAVSADQYKDSEQIAIPTINSRDDVRELELTASLERATVVPPAQTQPTAMQVCHFYGESNPGEPAWNKDEDCVIPRVESLDVAFHQGNFICCGGGASAPTSNADVPAGLEVRASGGHYWAVLHPRLQGEHFQIHTYCGPEGAPGPGCNVDVQVIAHYR